MLILGPQKLLRGFPGAGKLSNIILIVVFYLDHTQRMPLGTWYDAPMWLAAASASVGLTLRPDKA